MAFRLSIEAEGAPVWKTDTSQERFDPAKAYTLSIGNLTQGKSVDLRVTTGRDSYAGGVSRSIACELTAKLRNMGINPNIEVVDIPSVVNGEAVTTESVVRINLG